MKRKKEEEEKEREEEIKLEASIIEQISKPIDIENYTEEQDIEFQ